jgi:hypothetical protein
VIVACLSPFILVRAIRRGDDAMIGLVSIILTTVIVNAAVCGILSGPADRYESRVLWLLPLLGLLTVAAWPPSMRMPAPFTERRRKAV